MLKDDFTVERRHIVIDKQWRISNIYNSEDEAIRKCKLFMKNSNNQDVDFLIGCTVGTQEMPS